MPSYKVTAGHRLYHGETIYEGGQSVDLTKDQADSLVAAGKVVASTTPRAAASKSDWNKPEAKVEDKGGD
jgi:hypothetical protein